MSLWTPKFLDENAFGLDISDRSFKYAKLKKEKGVIDVAVFGKGSFPDGAIVTGEIKNLEAAANALAHTINSANLFTKNVVIALPEEKGFLRKIDIPFDTPEEEVRALLELHLEEHIPIALEEILFDYEIIPFDASIKQEGNPHREVIVTAFPRTVVERYLELAHRAGLNPVIIETETHALLRAAVPKEEHRTVMAIDMGETRSGFLIADRGVVAFTSTKLIGGNAMIDAIQRSTNSSPKEALRLFYEEGLNPNHQEVFAALLPMVSTLRDEIAQHVAFWQTHHFSRPTHVYLTGGIAHLEGLPEYLSYELDIPVSRAELGKSLFDLKKIIPAINHHDASLWAIALGLAARTI